MSGKNIREDKGLYDIVYSDAGGILNFLPDTIMIIMLKKATDS